MTMKKLAALMTAGCLAFGLAACGGIDSGAAASASTSEAKAESAQTETKEESKAETKEETKEESSAASTETASAETVKVGVLLPLSGATSYYGGVQLDGLKFCVDYYNRNGGIKSLGGAQVELVIQDSAGSPETGISAFESLVDDKEISAIIGPYNSTVAAATAPLAIQHEVPYVIINATAENFMGEPNKWVYRTNTGSGDGDMIYALAIEHLNNVRPDNPTDKVAIVYDSGDWGTAASATWTSTAEEMGYEVVLNEAVSESSTDLSTIVNKMKSEDVDVCILAAFSAATNLLVKQMYEYGCDTKVMSIGGGVGDIEFIENIKKDILFDNMTLEDNLSVNLSKKIGRFSGIINRRMHSYLVKDFRRSVQIDDEQREVKELSLLQKKIIAVKRWCVIKPEYLFIDDIFSELTIEESKSMLSYLEMEQKNGVNIVLFLNAQEVNSLLSTIND